MKLATFTHNGTTRVGVVRDGTIIDLAAADAALPGSMLEIVEGGSDMLARVAKAADSGKGALPLSDVHLEAPLPNPGKVLAIGLNYADHIAESGMETPQHQIWFNKQRTCIVGPSDGIVKPEVSDAVDYEAEMAMIIGRRCRHVPRERAHEVIFGFTVGNDVSVRDWQLRTPTFTMGKSFDTHGPTGPWIVTADEIGDPHTLDMKCWVNGELRQDSNTRHLVFDCFDQIAELTTAFTLEPGDIIFTGTSGGVGVAKKPPVFLKVGDEVKVEIEKIGAITNKVVAEKVETLIT